MCSEAEVQTQAVVNGTTDRAGSILSADARAILESIADAFYALDTSGRFIYVNRRALTFWGLSWDEVIGRTIWDKFPQIIGTPIETGLRRARDGESITSEEVSPVVGRWVSVSFYPSAFGVSVYWRDITDRVEAAQRLRASEEYLLLAQEAAGIGTWAWDLRTGQIRWSSGMFRVLGVDPATPPEHLYEAWMRVLHPADRADVVDAETRRLRAQVGPFSHEFRVIRPDGEERWILAQGAVSGEQGRPARMLGLNIDITERKRTEAALQESQERLRHLNERLEQEAERRARQLAESRARLQTFFDISLDWLSLFRAEADGSFVYVDLNPACQRAYGLIREQVIGRRVDDILGAEQAEVPLGHLRACLRTGQSQRYQARRTLAGRTRTIDVVFVPVPVETEDGERLIVSTARDLTEQEELEAQLRQVQKLELARPAYRRHSARFQQPTFGRAGLA